MGEVVYNQYESFAAGAITALHGQDIPKEALQYARNTVLVDEGAGKAAVGKRLGVRLMNATPVTGSPAIIGQYEYRRFSGGVFTNYHVITSATGRVERLGTDGTLTTISATGLTSGTYYPDFETANNLLFVVNGQDRKKWDATTWTDFGITRPTVGSMAGAAGAAGSHNGTYELRVVYANSVTGHKSSASNTASATVIVASQQISWSGIPTSADAQVDTRYLYVRNTATQANFYLAGTIANNTDTTATTNVADSALTELAPDTSENDPPPSGVRYLAWHKSRLFAADTTKLYYSKVGLPEAFDPDAYELINPSDGQVITGLVSFNEVLYIFKTTSLYALYGDDPQTWVVRLVDPTAGCCSHRTICTADSAIFWWSTVHGPTRLDPNAEKPRDIGIPIEPTHDGDAIQYDQLTAACAAHDITNSRIYFAVADLTQTRNTLLLPYNYRGGVWEATGWDPMDMASLGEALDSTNTPYVFLGGYAGQVFKMNIGRNDGVPSGTSSGTFVAGSTSVTTITDAGASFLTTGGKLIERRLTLLDSAGQKAVRRARITDNTGTVLTFTPAISVTNGATYTYLIGGPDWEFDTKWDDFGNPFMKKRYEFTWLQGSSTSSSLSVVMDVFLNFAESGTPTTVTFTTSGLWGEDWGSLIWSGSGLSSTRRTRIGKTGRNIKLRFRNHYPDQDAIVRKVAIQGELLTTKLG